MGLILHYVYSAVSLDANDVESMVLGVLPVSYMHFVMMFLVMAGGVVAALTAYWNVAFRVKVMFEVMEGIDSAATFEKAAMSRIGEKATEQMYAYVVPKQHQGKPEIVPLEMQKVLGSKPQIFFWFQRRKFKFNLDTNVFEKPQYENEEKIQYYLDYTGLETTKQIKEKISDYGMNRLDVPLPSFWELFKEHALAPFFVFQVACVGLWCLDEYWYYSLFTLFMLFAFESTLVKQRQRNMNQVRQMSSKPIRLMVCRRNRWQEISSDGLVPGDIISIRKMEDQQNQEVVVPCDVLLRAGKCVTNEALLTGESTPQLKESIEEHDNPEDNLNVKKGDKRHVVFGGTKILQHNHNFSQQQKAERPELCPPDGGCVGIVMKTGFETSQGKLVRTILFTTEHVTANNAEALYFILFLLVFALAASAYVFWKGINDPNRSKYKLLLNCIMIITSVVPPELPMELSMAVNNSLMTLQKLAIFCTQPFRIPYGGRITICCFDKTGTLTSDKMHLKYITNHQTHAKLKVTDALPEAKLVLGACHSLINMEGQIVGDPMETAALEGVHAKYKEDKVSLNASKILIHKRFAFASELKRMSTIVERDGKYYVLCKGAPETIKTMLTSCPDKFDEEVSQFSSEGVRVIALAWREYNPPSNVNMKQSATLKHIQREDVERNLEFCGFAAFDSGIKPDTYETMKELVESDHKVMMITGDNPLTACHVARELLFVNKPILIATKTSAGKFEWRSETTEEIVDLDKYDNSYDYCVTGDILELKQNDTKWLNTWIPIIAVFARTTPVQKELILTTLKNLNYGTLMCGDGTNDVGALKQADVGVALLERKKKNGTDEVNQKKKEPQPKKKFEPPKSFSEAIQQAKERARAAQTKGGNNNAFALDDENTVVQLGDASIAAPFTSKIGNIRSVYHIIRQGRCTLATTMQMYKVLALNCLISAYSLSVLYLDGIKYGDSQMILSGIGVSMAFLFVTRSQPLAKLSKERPQNSIFNFYFMFSLMGQFFIHILILVLTAQAAKVAQPPDDYDKSVDAEFKPNLVNSVVFIVTSLQTVVTFVVNYVGHPFMQSLRENRGLFICLAVLGGICLTAASNLSPELNEGMELLMMPSDHFRNFFMVMLVGDIVVCLGWEYLCKLLFSQE